LEAGTRRIDDLFSAEAEELSLFSPVSRQFDEAIATCDVLYDLAFLLMDLWTRGLRSHANLLFNWYLWICDDVERQLKGLSLLPLFLSLRAAIIFSLHIFRTFT
jgi:aminoglycoside phosphotransferase family enzyme